MADVLRSVRQLGIGKRVIEAATSCALLLSLIFVPMIVLNRRDRRAERNAGTWRR